MLLLIAFAFLAGIVTVLSPCILPVLPIILSSSVDNSGKKRPLGVVVGFVGSFTFFTLFLSSIVKWSGIPADSLRFFAIVVIGLFGVSLLIPAFQAWLEQVFSKLTSLAPSGQNKHGFGGGLLVGLSLGLLWTPCVGPILASVISLALVGNVTAEAFFITAAYALGTGLPMFAIMMLGSTALQKVPWLLRNTPLIQKIFGVIMVCVALGIFLNWDRLFQTWILETFPNYGIGLTKIEDNEVVKKELEKNAQKPTPQSQIGKPMSEVMRVNGPMAPDLIAGGEWINSQPLTMSELRGKVVLIDFWTYSCINCQRTFPYLKTWWEKYKDEGLVIIGVHSPEFEFEKNIKNVEKAAQDFGLTYPIMQDNDFATWKEYDNRYWPAKYLIDKDGVIRYHHFGEGEYANTEIKIQNLLGEAGNNVYEKGLQNPGYKTYGRTPETYLGYLRMDALVSLEGVKSDAKYVYTAPKFVPDNTFALSGEWSITPEYSQPEKGSTLILEFEAKEVFLVARPKQGSSQFKVLVDEGAVQPGGEDIQDGLVTVDADTLYKVINLDEPGKHTLKLEFVDNNIELYAFTFG